VGVFVTPPGPRSSTGEKGVGQLSNIMKVGQRMAVTGGAAVLVFGAGAVGTQDTASASWENCGEYTCTTYSTRSETKQLLRDVQEVTSTGKDIGAGACGLLLAGAGGVAGFFLGGIGAPIGMGIGGAAAAVVCPAWHHSVEPSEMEKLLQTAVDHDGCYQVETDKGAGANPRFGWTNAEGWCRD
jgi:hypothetical protein